MRIDVRDAEGRRLGRVEVDPALRPSLVRLAEPGGGDESSREHFLNWEEALDDAGNLRRCVLCGCSSLYRSKVFPQITPFVIVPAFAGAALGFLGYARHPVVLPALLGLLAIDVATLALARTRLVCYRCGSIYSRCGIARYHRRWQRGEAERVRAADDAVASAAGS